jgi:hypothetical protein
MECWEKRACDAEMQERCPHCVPDVYSPCPAECYYTICGEATRRLSTNMELILDPTVDRRGAVKENCVMCEFFLRYGPRLRG